MKQALTLALLAAIPFAAEAAVAADAPTTFPPGYWDRGYGFNPNATATYYNVAIRVKSMSKAEAEVDRRMAKVAASLINLNNNFVYDNGQPMQEQRSRCMSYSIPDAKAESAAKSLFDLGELQQYNTQKQQASTQLDEINQKLKLVDEELGKHADALKDMPVATYFLNTQHARLTQAKESFEGGRNKATLNITLIEPVDAK